MSTTVKYFKAYKTEIDPNNAQKTFLLKHIDAARLVYNWAVYQRDSIYKETGKTINFYYQNKLLTQLKKEKIWLKSVSSYATEAALIHVDKAFKNFFKNIKKGLPFDEAGFPNFKSKKMSEQSFEIRRAIKITDTHIILPLGLEIKLKQYGYIPTNKKPRTATVTVKNDHWYVSVLFEVDRPEIDPPTGETIGVDFGIKTLAVCSDGRSFPNHNTLKKHAKKIKRFQRELARRFKKGEKKQSGNYYKTKKRLAKEHEKIANIRNDCTHKVTSAIVAKTKPSAERPKSIVIEDLNVKGMMKNHCLAGSIANASFGEMRRQFEYKAKWSGVELVLANRYYPSSKLCSDCGYKNTELKLKHREWVCPKCGVVHDRDINAAINLKNYCASTASPAGSNAYGDRNQTLPTGEAVAEIGINHQHRLIGGMG